MTTTNSDMEIYQSDGERAKEAYYRHLGGETWDEIALEMGYASGDSARVGVRVALQKAALNLGQEILDEILQTELDSLAVLQKGDRKSVV